MKEAGLNAYIIGSILKKPLVFCSDVDLVLYVNIENVSIESTISIIKELRTGFIKEFEKPLHITTFTNNELVELTSFLDRQPHKLIVMGKNINYQVIDFCTKNVLNHNAVESYEDVSTSDYFIFKLKRKRGMSDVIVLYDDSYHFGQIALIEAISELPQGGIILIPRPESTIKEDIDLPDCDVNIYVGKIGEVMGALHKDEFWTYVKKENRKNNS